jgi:hypothetical protein
MRIVQKLPTELMNEQGLLLVWHYISRVEEEINLKTKLYYEVCHLLRFGAV